MFDYVKKELYECMKETVDVRGNYINELKSELNEYQMLLKKVNGSISAGTQLLERV